MGKIITEAAEAWNLLNGVVCLYKSAGESAKRARASFLNKLCLELNAMEIRPSTYVAIEGKTNDTMDVMVRPNYADMPLVTGPRYRAEDFNTVWGSKLGYNTSGVYVMGLNNGLKKAVAIRNSHPLRTYRLKGEFGYVTDNLFRTGKIVDRSKYSHVKPLAIDQHLAAVQASHQRLAYETAGVNPSSQEAYDLAVRGLIRPMDHNTPIIYGAKLIEYAAPHFTIELSSINEYEDYLLAQIHNLGDRLNSTATCTMIQCVHHSFFRLEDALLKKHWDLKSVIANMANSNRLIRRQGYVVPGNLDKYRAKS